jgi:hypothetical protein
MTNNSEVAASARQGLQNRSAAGLGEAVGLGEDQELGGVSWIRHAVITALRPKVGVDAVSKYANHSSVTVTEEVYDLDKEALELKSQAVEQARKIFRLGASRKTKRIPRQLRQNRSATRRGPPRF